MATYWKSQPKKFCEFCKCWTADNKASIDFHESGKKHKENKTRKLDELRSKSFKNEQAKAETESMLEEMNRAAMKSFKDDLRTNPDIANAYGSLSKSSGVQQSRKRETEPPLTAAKKRCLWETATSPEGYTYYWNMETHETSWELPDDLKEEHGKETVPEAAEKVSADGDTAIQTEPGLAKTSEPSKGDTSHERDTDKADVKVKEEVTSKDLEKKSSMKKENTVAKKEVKGEGTVVKKEGEDNSKNGQAEEKKAAAPSFKFNSKKTKPKSAFGQWEAVQKAPAVDLQLPSSKAASVNRNKMLDLLNRDSDEEEGQTSGFTERTVGTNSGVKQEPVGFKKFKAKERSIRGGNSKE